MNERRIESRYLCADIVRVSWMEKADNGDSRRQKQRQSNEAVLEDISARGICIQMDQPIAEGTRVHSFLGEADFEGFVCYCSFQEIGYFIGIHFDDEARWTTHLYRPQHLTNLRELADRAH